MAAVAGTLFHLLLVTLMVFFHLISSLNAVPLTRVESLMRGAQVLQLSEKSNLVTAEKSWEMNERMMSMEINDYPGSGANNRHTPRPQFGRGCVDC